MAFQCKTLYYKYFFHQFELEKLRFSIKRKVLKILKKIFERSVNQILKLRIRTFDVISFSKFFYDLLIYPFEVLKPF